MLSFTEDTAAQAVLDGLRDNTDISEPLGHFCHCLIEKKKLANLRKYCRDMRFVKVLDADYDRTLSYLWERAKQMLLRLRPTDSKHLYSLMTRLMHFTHADVYRAEDRDKVGYFDAKQKRGKAREKVHIVEGSLPVANPQQLDNKKHATLMDVLPAANADAYTRHLEATEELTYYLDMAAALHNDSFNNPHSRRLNTSKLFKKIMFGLLEGRTFAEMAEELHLHPSRISQIHGDVCYRLAGIAKSQSPQDHVDVLLPTLAHSISKAINKSRPRHAYGKSKTGVRHVLSPREKKEN